MRIKHISKTFDKKSVLEDFSLNIKKNTIVCLIGPSGCGKTTLLNIIAGFVEQDEGNIECEEEKKISYLFQEPRLLPNLNVLRNVSCVLKGNKTEAVAILEKVGLGDCLKKYPSQLSGGQRQRVAIARAFAFDSDIILMDEPFQNLDVKVRNNLTNEFLDMWKNNQKTVVWVTHDISEACLAADKILCLSAGPMQVKQTFNIRIPRGKRTSEKISALYSQIYNTLTQD